MIKLDDDLLQELGLANLPPEEKRKLLAHIYETLEMRVGMKLAEQMSDAQLSEFEQFIDRNDEAGALNWLETNFPNYKDVVSQEFDRLKMEIGQAAPQIAAAAASAPADNGQYQQPVNPMGPAPQAMPGQPAPMDASAGYGAPAGQAPYGAPGQPSGQPGMPQTPEDQAEQRRNDLGLAA